MVAALAVVAPAYAALGVMRAATVLATLFALSPAVAFAMLVIGLVGGLAALSLEAPVFAAPGASQLGALLFELSWAGSRPMVVQPTIAAAPKPGWRVVPSFDWRPLLRGPVGSVPMTVRSPVPVVQAATLVGGRSAAQRAAARGAIARVSIARVSIARGASAAFGRSRVD